jgi:hypothetical protein
MPENELQGLTRGGGRGEQVVVARVVQRGRTGAPVDHGSDEAETRRAFELDGGSPRVGHGQGRERVSSARGQNGNSANPDRCGARPSRGKQSRPRGFCMRGGMV